MAAFTWIPDQGVTKTVSPRVRTSKFGDGYSQDVVDGLNPIEESWPVTFSTRTKTEILAIDTFLTNNIGLSFDWTTPEGVSKKYVCKSWSASFVHDGDASLTGTFDRVYRL